MPAIPKNPFIIVDGSSYLFRAYHALPPLTTSKGLPSGAIYGVVNMLRKLISQYAPQQMAVVFDSKEKTFRHEVFPTYKANRTEMPAELAPQIMPLQQIVVAMGLPLIVMPGIEADDIIGTLAVQARAAGLFTLISTGDKDMAQLVNSDVMLINTMSDTILDIAGVKEKFEVTPEQIIDYLSLVGDQSDNIPGVPKVGPKTAVKWLEQYGSLQGIISNAAQITGKVGENLRATLDQLPLYQQLTTIKTDIALNYKLDDLHITAPKIAELKHLFGEFEFKRWLQELDAKPSLVNKLALVTKEHDDSDDNNDMVMVEQDELTTTITRQDANRNITMKVSRQEVLGTNVYYLADRQKTSVQSIQLDATKYQTILTEADFSVLMIQLQQATTIAIELATTSLDYMVAELVGVTICIAPGQSAYIPVMHDYLGAPKQLNRDGVLQQLQMLLAVADKTIIGHDLKYSLGMLANYGLKVKAKLYDTMLASYVLDSVSGKHDLDALALRHLSYTNTSYESVTGKGAKQIKFNQVPLEQATAYAAENADIIFRLYTQLSEQLAAYPTLQQLFSSIEMPLMPVIAEMEQHGVMIDVPALQQQGKEIGERLAEIETEIFAVAGEEFNINSPKQLQEVLFVRLKLPVLEKTPTGQPSTAESVLEELSAQYPLPRLILEYRSLSKLKSTYTDSLPQQINLRTQRVHTSYHQANTATGRLSSSSPNLQNIPIRSPLGKRIRTAFIAPPGYKILAADYSQIELRIMAHLSGDPGLLAAFKQGLDIHTATAAEVFGVAVEQVTEDQRRHAKAINFGLIYGMSAFGLAKQLAVSRAEAELYINKYFTKFPQVRDFMQQTRELAARQGYVETLFGRRLYLPDINSKNMGRRKAAERAAINAPMQGGQADIIKLAMIKIAAWLKANNMPAQMIMQVHDELILEVKAEQVEAVKAQVVKLMMGAADLAVALEVGVGVGNNWGEAH